MRRHLLAYALLTVLATSLRCWKLDLAQFQNSDDVRDWKRAGGLLLGHEPWWLGPEAALATGEGVRPPGGFYYLLLSSAYRVSRNPLSGLALIATLGSAAAVLTYPLALLILPRGPALVAGLLAATTPIWVIASRGIWNPNPVPLFAVLFYLGLCAWRLHRRQWGLVTAMICLSLLLQLHLSALALLPLALLSVAGTLRRPRQLLLAVSALTIPLVPFLAKVSPDELRDTVRLGRALTIMSRQAQEDRSRSLPVPICWPLPYLPPLSSATYGAEFLDRNAASLLRADSPELEDSSALDLYWKGSLTETLRSFDLRSLAEKARAHRRLPRSLQTQFAADTVCSLFLMAGIVVGFIALVIDSLRGDGKARTLLWPVVTLLVVTLLPGIQDSYHFYYIFFPLPVLLPGWALYRAGRFHRGATLLFLLVAAVSGLLMIDRLMSIEKLGGAPSYGVPHRYRAQAARWLKQRECSRLNDVEIMGSGAPWTFLLRRGGGPPRFQVLELSEGALGAICGEGPHACGESWLSMRRAWAPRLACQIGGIWIYRLGNESTSLPGSPSIAAPG